MKSKETVNCGLCGREGTLKGNDHIADFKLCTDCVKVVDKYTAPRGF